MSLEERVIEAAEVLSPSEIEPEADSNAEPALKAKPVEETERLASVDVIRGVALLGILAMNINGFGWPDPVYSTPTGDPDAGTLDVALWAFNHLVFDTKMMTLFSMLFGAGLVLMGDRAEARGATFRGVYYRRVTWLLVIGAIHAYLIWEGDVLVFYALCGFLLYPFRRLGPKTLIITGLCFNLMIVPVLLGFKYVVVPYMETTAKKFNEREEAWKTATKDHPADKNIKKLKPDGWDAEVRDGWQEMKNRKPRRADFLKAIAVRRSDYFTIVKARAKEQIWGHTFGFVLGMWWFAGGRMLMGMGLMKLGVFGAKCSRNTYRLMMVFGYGIGLPVMAFDIYHQITNDFFVGRSLEYTLQFWPTLLIYGSLPVVVGHIGLVMLICRSNAIPWLTRRLAAVGRMALSNYLFDSIVFTTLFYGYGLDFYASLHRPMLYLLVLAVWTFQLLVSPIWLEYFRFGPAEWLWRSLTYWKLQSMRPKHRMEPLPVG